MSAFFATFAIIQKIDYDSIPCCKINLGLNVVGKRPDGYHDIETVFYPVPLCDALEVAEMDTQFPSPYDCDLKVTGNAVDCDEQKNLVAGALPPAAPARPRARRIITHLYKRIPSQAGLGGGSADAATPCACSTSSLEPISPTPTCGCWPSAWAPTAPSSSATPLPTPPASATSSPRCPTRRSRAIGWPS